MVKAGVYLLARLSPALGGTELWTAVLVPVGGFTMLLASVWAMRQTDLKLMLAYTTVMALALMTMLIGIGTPAAIAAAMTFLLVHAFYKAALFLAVGMVEKGAGARAYPAVAGLARRDAADRGRGGPRRPLHGRPPAALRLHRQGARLRGDRPRARLGAGRDRGGPRRQRADGGLRRAWWRSAPSSSRRRGAPRTTRPTPTGASALGPVILAALGLLCGLAPALIGDGLVAPMVAAVSGRAMDGAPRPLARHRARPSSSAS